MFGSVQQDAVGLRFKLETFIGKQNRASFVWIYRKLDTIRRTKGFTRAQGARTHRPHLVLRTPRPLRFQSFTWLFVI